MQGQIHISPPQDLYHIDKEELFDRSLPKKLQAKAMTGLPIGHPQNSFMATGSGIGFNVAASAALHASLSERGDTTESSRQALDAMKLTKSAFRSPQVISQRLPQTRIIGAIRNAMDPEPNVEQSPSFYSSTLFPPDHFGMTQRVPSG